MRRFLLWLPVCGLTVIAVNSALAKGGTIMHERLSTSRADTPTYQPSLPSKGFGACGRGRYREPRTHKRRGPADFGN